MTQTGRHCCLALSVLSVVSAGLLIGDWIPYLLGILAASAGGGLAVVAWLFGTARERN